MTDRRVECEPDPIRRLGIDSVVQAGTIAPRPGIGLEHRAGHDVGPYRPGSTRPGRTPRTTSPGGVTGVRLRSQVGSRFPIPFAPKGLVRRMSFGSNVSAASSAIAIASPVSSPK